MAPVGIMAYVSQTAGRLGSEDGGAGHTTRVRRGWVLGHGVADRRRAKLLQLVGGVEGEDGEAGGQGRQAGREIMRSASVVGRPTAHGEMHRTGSRGAYARARRVLFVLAG